MFFFLDDGSFDDDNFSDNDWEASNGPYFESDEVINLNIFTLIIYIILN